MSIVSLSIILPNELLSIKDHKEIRGASTTSATTAGARSAPTPAEGGRAVVADVVDAPRISL